jgi:hypothetical protein
LIAKGDAHDERRTLLELGAIRIGHRVARLLRVDARIGRRVRGARSTRPGGPAVGCRTGTAGPSGARSAATARGISTGSDAPGSSPRTCSAATCPASPCVPACRRRTACRAGSTGTPLRAPSAAAGTGPGATPADSGGPRPRSQGGAADRGSSQKNKPASHFVPLSRCARR